MSPCDCSRANDLGTASCRDGEPSGRIADETKRAGDPVAVMVWIALGVGGANPPVIPVDSS